MLGAQLLEMKHMMERLSMATRFVARQDADDPGQKIIELISDPFSSEASRLLTRPFLLSRGI